MKYVISLVFAATLANAAMAQHIEFSWLVGKWKMKDKNVYEFWAVDPDGKTLIGNSFRMKGTDTIKMEQIRFTFSQDRYHYIPDVAGEQGPVDFTLTQFDKFGFVAENPQHDFPKIIRYKYFSNASEEWIEASIEGDGKVIPYHFFRVK